MRVLFADSRSSTKSIRVVLILWSATWSVLHASGVSRLSPPWPAVPQHAWSNARHASNCVAYHSLFHSLQISRIRKYMCSPTLTTFDARRVVRLDDHLREEAERRREGGREAKHMHRTIFLGGAETSYWPVLCRSRCFGRQCCRALVVACRWLAWCKGRLCNVSTVSLSVRRRTE